MRSTLALPPASLSQVTRRRIRALMGEAAAAEIFEVGEGGGYEIVSPDGRTIEVKGTAGSKPNNGFVFNSAQELAHLERGGYIYRVTEVFGPTPRIYILSLPHVKVTPRYRADARARFGQVSHCTPFTCPFFEALGPGPLRRNLRPLLSPAAKARLTPNNSFKPNPLRGSA
jgi:hypothetical protein